MMPGFANRVGLQVLDAVKDCHAKLHQCEVPRVLMNIQLDTRKSGKASMEDMVEKVVTLDSRTMMLKFNLQ